MRISDWSSDVCSSDLLEREAAGLPDPALLLVGADAQMGMTGIDVRPGVDDADDGLPGEIAGVIPHLLQSGAVAERAQVLDAEPAVASQLLWPFHSILPDDTVPAKYDKRSEERREGTGWVITYK